MIRRPPRSTLFPYTTSSDLPSEPEHSDPPYAPSAGTAHTDRVRRHWCGWNERGRARSEEHTSELQSHSDLVCRLLLEKKNKKKKKKQSKKVSDRKGCIELHR